MFFFHSRNIPEANKNEGFKVGLENIIKIFYRPVGLQTKSEDAFKNLGITSTPTGIKLNNNSPYYINLAGLSINNTLLKLDKQNNTIPPFSVMNYSALQKSGAVTWRVINELGGTNEYKTVVQ